MDAFSGYHPLINFTYFTIVIGLSMFPSLIVAVIYKETVSFLAFLGTILFAAVCGFFLLFLCFSLFIL